MRKIRYRLLFRFTLVFALLAAVLVGVLLALSFERSLQNERKYAQEKLSIVIKGLQSTYVSYAVQGEAPDDETLLSAAKQIDITAEIERVSSESASVTHILNKTMHAASDARLGGGLYRVSIARDMQGLYTFRENFLSVYRALYLVLLPVGMLFMYTAGRSITRPVEALKEASDAFCAGDNSKRVSIKTGDELQALSESFNRMKDAVEGEIERREILISNLTHEMKTPLQAVLGHAEIICRDALSEEERLLAAGTIRHEALRLDRLSARMMDWLHCGFPENAVFSPVSVQHMLENVQSAFETRMKITVACEDVFVYADSVLMETLLMNLLDNSANAGAKEISVCAEKTERGIVFSVTDDGSGMEKETLLHLEEPFYREDKARTRAHGGAGLGLSLAARIADIHNTSLRYESEKGKGTRVEFVLAEAEND